MLLRAGLRHNRPSTRPWPALARRATEGQYNRLQDVKEPAERQYARGRKGIKPYYNHHITPL